MFYSSQNLRLLLTVLQSLFPHGSHHTTVLVLSVFIVEEFLCGGTNKRNRLFRIRSANRQRNRDYALREMEALSEHHFKRMFRMSRHAFNQLVIKLEDHYQHPWEVAAVNSAGSSISLRTRLAVALRWLAGGSYIDIGFEFGVAYGSFYHILWETLELLDQALDLSFPFGNSNQLETIAQSYARYSHGNFRKCVLAIDGWVCRTRCPTSAEARFPMAYRNRHGCFGIVVLAGCYSNLKFGMFSCISSGSTNDILAWDLCEMKRLLDCGSLPSEYYFIGDEAFTNTQQFLVPWSKSHIHDEFKDSYNFYLSSMRQCIERAFSHLVLRWGIFSRELKCAFKKWPLVCMVAAKLHNFCIDENEGERKDIPPMYSDDYEIGDDPTALLNVFQDPDDPDAHVNRPTGSRRKDITNYLRDNGIRRPRRNE